MLCTTLRTMLCTMHRTTHRTAPHHAQVAYASTIANP